MYNDTQLSFDIYADELIIKPNVICSLWEASQGGHQYYVLLSAKVVSINKVKRICHSINTHQPEDKLRCKVVEKERIEFLKIGANKIPHLIKMLQKIPGITDKPMEFFI